MTTTPPYDVFISHAFEDKEAFANELALELTKAGLRVWYSGFELKLGDSISISINEALKKSAFGIVLISPVYLQKQWAMNELNALFAKETGQYRILPILLNITIEDIRNQFPILADRYMISADSGINTVIKKILLALSSTKKGQDSSYKKDQANINTKVYSNNSTMQNKNINKQTQNVTVKSGSGTAIILILIALIAIGIYFVFQASAEPEPHIDKQNIFPSNTN